MTITNNFQKSLHIILRDLIEEKSKRDQVKFTGAQLANSLCMPRSMITKLMHLDATKRVINPRIDTLLKIVEFFRADGFNITIDDLLGTTKNTIDVKQQKKIPQNTSKKIPLYSFNSAFNLKVGSINVNLTQKSKNIFALYAEKDINPFFKMGSTFIIDKDQQPEDDMLVAVNPKGSTEVYIRKYYVEKNQIFLRSLDINEKPIILLLNSEINFLGVVIQINATTK